MSRRSQLSVASSILHRMVELGAAAEVQPPDLVVFLHLVIDATKNPDTSVPDPAGMVVARHESPCSRPGPCLQVEIADVVQNAIMTSLSTTDIKLVVIDDSGVARSSSRNRAVKLRLRPVRCLQIEDYNVGKVLAMLVLATKNEQFAALPEACCMACEEWSV